MKHSLIIIIGFFLIISCNNVDYEQKFIESYSDFEFVDFVNYSFIIRSIHDTTLIVFVSTNYGEDNNGGPYVLTVSKYGSNIYDSSTHLMGIDSIDVDRQYIHQHLLPKFLKMRINSLSVDKDTNVFVRTSNYDKPNLIRIGSSNGIPSIYSDWIVLGGGWIKRKD